MRYSTRRWLMLTVCYTFIAVMLVLFAATLPIPFVWIVLGVIAFFGAVVLSLVYQQIVWRFAQVMLRDNRCPVCEQPTVSQMNEHKPYVCGNCGARFFAYGRKTKPNRNA
jgi:uncharacterized paraquat-inducible protein A